jgi:putative DNA primase/helicase
MTAIYEEIPGPCRREASDYFCRPRRDSATGLAAACECAHANLVAKNDLQRVSVYWPDHDDFNNMLMNGDQVRELVFYKKQQVAA